MARDDVGLKIELTLLLDFYGGLLTEKQRMILSMHCEEDLSLSEIAAETGISRQGVHEQLSRASERLFQYEQALGVAARFTQMQDNLQRCLDLMRKAKYDEAESLIEKVIQREQEESNGL